MPADRSSTVRALRPAKMDPHDTDRVIPTGFLLLDVVTGTGGLPRGRITELFGHEDGGMADIAQLAVANAQQAGELAVYVDVDRTFDGEVAKRYGVTDDLIIARPDTAEDAMTMVQMMVRWEVPPAIIVLDSIAGLVTREELESPMGDPSTQALGRLLRRKLRKLERALVESNTALVLLNQLREDPTSRDGQGRPVVREFAPGGRGPKQFSAIRLQILEHRLEPNVDDRIMEGYPRTVVGFRTRVQVVKNLLAPRTKGNVAWFDLMFECGVNHFMDLFHVGRAMDLIARTAGFSFNGYDLGRYTEAAVECLAGDPTLAAELEDAIYSKFSFPEWEA